MQNSRFGIFSNDKLFLAFSAVDVAIGLFMGVLCFINKDIDFVIVPFIAVLALCLYLSYKDHQKNVMKGLMGASLMWLFAEETEYVKAIAFYDKDYYTAAFGDQYKTFLGVKIITVILIFSVFVFHFLINSEHHSSPFEVGANKFLSIAIAAAYAADMVFTGVCTGKFATIMVCYCLFKIFLMLMVVCVEAKLDIFRLKREENGWTEE